MAIDKTIRAAGAVLSRGDDDSREYLLVHRSLRDDWTFPKGKLEPAEDAAGAAIREVREETGFAIQLGVPLPTQNYKANGKPKTVTYWHASILSGEFLPNDEVDEIKWLPFETARELLTYEHDAEVIDAAHLARATSPLIVMRHTQALKRVDWTVSAANRSNRDADRPLTTVGRVQAAGVIPSLAAYGITNIHTSDSTRCRDTVGPYATARSLSIVLETAISEEGHKVDVDGARARIAELAISNQPTVICTHRPVLPTVMNALKDEFVLDDSFVNHSETGEIFDPALSPGSMVVFHRDALNLKRILAVEVHVHGM